MEKCKLNQFCSTNHLSYFFYCIIFIILYLSLLGFTGFVSGLLSYLDLEEESNPKDALILIIKRGILTMNEKEFDKAEIILHAALSAAQQQVSVE